MEAKHMQEGGGGGVSAQLLIIVGVRLLIVITARILVVITAQLLVVVSAQLLVIVSGRLLRQSTSSYMKGRRQKESEIGVNKERKKMEAKNIPERGGMGISAWLLIVVSARLLVVISGRLLLQSTSSYTERGNNRKVRLE